MFVLTFLISLNPFPNSSLDASKPKEFADNNFKFDENEEFSKWVEDTVGKGEIAPFPIVFSIDL